jgi:RNA polymerase sigma factor (sigma-70 family)
MAELTDHELLADFARTGAESAFAALVTRHVNLVYSAAKRFAADDSLAADITQAVFILLARKAGGISSKTILTGWLYQTARLTAANALKEKIRRQNREHEAFMQSTLTQNETDDAWKQIAPVLDDAMGNLREADRDAVLLRYFENKPLAEVGAALGVSEDAARVRVNRALEKLRATLTKSGVTLGVTAITGAVTANAIQAAPVALATSITTAALTGTSLTIATIAMTTLQKIAVTAALTVTIGAGIYEAKQASDAHDENKMLQAQQAPMAEQIRQLQNHFADATNQLANMLAENSRLKSNPNQMELLKLRGKVTLLNNQANDPVLMSIKQWQAKVTQLKQRLEEMPGAKIPEMQFLTENDWVDAARSSNPDLIDFNKKGPVRLALSGLRWQAIRAFGWEMDKAFGKYVAANNWQLPEDIQKLKPYFDPPIDDALLQNYHMVTNGNVRKLPIPTIVMEQTKVADEFYDAKQFMYSYDNRNPKIDTWNGSWQATVGGGRRIQDDPDFETPMP